VALIKMTTDDSPEQPVVAAEDRKKAQLAPEPNTSLERRDYSVFTVGQKRAIVAIGSFASFFSPLSSSIYFPALQTISEQLDVSISKVNLTVTTYLVCFLFSHFELVSWHTNHFLIDSTGNRTYAYRWLLRYCRPTTCLYHLLHDLHRCQYRAFLTE